MMKRLFGIVFLIPFFLVAQKPTINSITPRNVEVGEVVTISGSNLGNASSRVFFGSVEATSVLGSANLLEAVVPPGVTQGHVTVLNTGNSLVGQSSELFYISFGGSASPSFGTETLVGTGAQDAFDICLCDLNADGLNDVVIAHDDLDGGREVSYFINNSTPTVTDFGAPVALDQASHENGFVSVACDDLNNDGTKNLVFATTDAENAFEVYIYPDIISSPTSSVTLTIPQIPGSPPINREPRALKISDIDNDGRKDIIVGNDNDNALHIFRNQGGFSFSSANEILVPEAPSTGSLDIADLNGDLLPDIVIVPFNESNGNIYVLRNNSLINNFSFIEQDIITNGDQRRNLVLGDFDQDGLPDIATTSDRTIGSTSGAERVSVFQNTSDSQTDGSISFSLVASLIIPSNLPWGIDAGDLNGDGLLDLAIACVGGDVYTLENTTTTTISFANAAIQDAAENSRNVAIGDLNGDAKPDLAYTHDVSLNSIGDLGVQMNTTCIDPTITPESFTFCTGDDFTLTATNSIAATYNWTVQSGTANSITPNGNEATFNLASASDATIRVEIVQGTCTTFTDYVVNFEPGSLTTTPTIQVDDTDGGVVCEGDEITLSTPGTFDSYLWTLPDGSTSTSSTITFSSVTADNAGEYSLIVRNNGNCSSVESTEIVTVDALPVPVIFNNDADIFCDDGANDPTLEIEPISGMTYQWKRDGTDITGSGTSLTVDQSGDYTIEIINTNGCTKESNSYSITAVSEPVSIIDAVTETCVDASTTFTAASTGQAGFTLEYSWEVNGTPVTPTSPTELITSFSTTGNQSVTLTTSYNTSEVASCSDQTVFNITVSPEPVVAFDQTDGTQKCQAETILIDVTTPNVSSYSWSVRNAELNGAIINANASTESSIDLTTPADVDSVYAIVDIITDIGCEVRDSIKIRNFPSTIDISSTDFASVATDNTALLEEAISLNLTAENSSNVSWEPADNFSDPNAPSTTFFPQAPITTVTLTGTDVDGCLASTEVIIELDNIRPRKTFSPNGDGINDCWEILNIGDLGATNECKVYIFDARGRNILVRDNFDQGNCVWEGNFGGSPVTEGVYYFVLKCNDDNLSKTGSILLAR